MDIREQTRRLEIFRGIEVFCEAEPMLACAPQYLRITATDKFVRISSYFGVRIVIDLERYKKGAASLASIDVDIPGLAQKFAIQGGEYLLPLWEDAASLLGDIRSMIVSENEEILKLKVLGLLVNIDDIDVDTGQVLPVESECTPRQAAVARTLYAHLMDNMDRHITIEDMAETFKLSPTQIKDSFRLYYGASIFGYIRAEKMRIAAHILCNSDSTVQNVATACGYSNGSKFAAAFSKVMGIGPREYRKRQAVRVAK